MSGFVARELSGFSVHKRGPFFEQEESGGRSHFLVSYSKVRSYP